MSINNIFPIELNPYQILGLNKNATSLEIELAFRKNLSRKPQFRSEISLAYAFLKEPPKSKRFLKLKESDFYKVLIYDEFYYAVVGDNIRLFNLIYNNKNIVNIKDKNGRSLLHIASTNGHYEVCSLLLESGANVNEFDNNHSTPLHSAVYYGHGNIIHLLISYGADVNQKNENEELPEDVAPSIKYKNIIKESRSDAILNLYYLLKSMNLIERIIKVKKYNIYTKTDEIIAIKFIPCSQLLQPDDFYTVWKNWVPAWHGTKLENIESILRNGLKEAGSKMMGGEMSGIITPKNGHIQFGKKINNIKNWAKAIFVSPSIFYSTHPIYAERINSTFFGNSWAVLIETRLLPGSYKAFQSTTARKVIKGEPSLIEYRVKSIDNITKKKNIHIIAISFVLDNFLNNVTDYDQGEILSNSQEERFIFE